MKNLLFTAGLIVASIGNMAAQETKNDFRDRVQLGLKLGMNYSNVYDEQGQDFVADPKAGFAAGAFMRLPIGKYLGLQPEILFSQRGFKGTGTLLGTSYSLTRTTNFIDVPVMLCLKPTGFVTLMAGPQFSYLIKQTDIFKNGTTTIAQENEFQNDNVRKNILCFTGGLDINVQHVVVSARAGWDFQKNNGDGTSSTPRYKNMWYQLTVGYRMYYANK